MPFRPQELRETGDRPFGEWPIWCIKMHNMGSDFLKNATDQRQITRIGYVSFATHEMGDESDWQILIDARSRNLKSNVTGFLFRTPSYFIQILEGRDQDVNETYARISRDNRHTKVHKWKSEQVGERLFPEWDMGYCATVEEDRFAFALTQSETSSPTNTVLTLKAMSETYT